MKVAVIGDSAAQQKLLAAVDHVLAEHDGLSEAGSPTWLHKEPLTRRFYKNPQGKPLKTQMTERFPLLSRRERRELLREADKLSRQKASVA